MLSFEWRTEVYGGSYAKVGNFDADLIIVRKLRAEQYSVKLLIGKPADQWERKIQATSSEDAKSKAQDLLIDILAMINGE